MARPILCALAALDDADPHVQAAVLGHIRRRGIPGMLSRLIDLLESPHLAVRQGAEEPCRVQF